MSDLNEKVATLLAIVKYDQNVRVSKVSYSAEENVLIENEKIIKK